MKVSESVKKMCDVLSCIPPDFKTAETLFAEQQPTEQELMWLAVELADNTFGEYRDMLNENCPRVTPGKVHRDYLYDTILFLLDHEMNPNTVVDEHTTEAENIMAVLRFTDGPDVAARTMRLLLEHGGDPNLDVDSLTPLSWMDDELCIEQIADALDVNLQYMCFLFKKQTDTTIGAYILQTRMEMAGRLFQRTNYNVTEVAQRVGFFDVSYFSKCFKKYFGVSPKQYQNVSSNYLKTT